MSAVYDPEVRSYIKKFDFIFLTETFSTKFPSFLFPSYEAYISPGVKVSYASTARLSGGVVLLVRKLYNSMIKQIEVEYDNTIVLLLHSVELDVLLIGMYIPPANSVYYSETEIDNGVSLLEQCILDVSEESGDFPMLIFGDLNARTGNLFAKELPEYSGDLMHDDDLTDGLCVSRISKDSTVNDFGRYLINMCEQLELVILNGVLQGDECGHYTYIAHNGSSVIDYFVASRSLLRFCSCLKINPRIESKHMPVEFNLMFTKHPQKREVQKPVAYKKFVWNPDNLSNYTSALESDNVTQLFDEATKLVDENIESALTIFNKGLAIAGECMIKVIVTGKDRHSPWFDSDCFCKRKEARAALRLYNSEKFTNQANNLRQKYTSIRNQYKTMLREKKLQYRQKVLQDLDVNANNSKQFWRTVKFARGAETKQNSISKVEWFQHFMKIFNDVNSVSDSNIQDVCTNGECLDNANFTFLDNDITVEEVHNSIKAVKSNKAPGPDGLIGELYKHSSLAMVQFLTRYFNKLFVTGTFPSAWCEALLQPLHKKGDINCPDNYRGISLLNVSGKLYSYILNKRLTKWIEDEHVINEAQAGFRRNYSTVDHIFTLLSIVQKQLRNHRKLYVAFIDFKKAFDLVDRNKLWSVLKKNGIGGRMYQAIKSMYAVVKAKVKVGGDLTDSFMCPRGLKQGEICSPVLFSLFINELAEEIIKGGKHGIPLSPDLLQILIMLFADDIILVSSTVSGLQQQLNVLCNTAHSLDLTVNLQKSNVVIFRNGGYISSKEKWYFDGSLMKIVNQYKYLGVIFSTGLTFSHCLEDLSSRAKHQVINILRLLWKFQSLSPKLFFKLFDCQIQPMLTYGAEVWGLTANHSAIEKIHLFALKRFLNVSIKTPNALVYAETGRYPLYINTYTKCIRYWLHIVNMSDDRLPKKSYDMLCSIQHRNKDTWVSAVRSTLYRFGYGYVWESQGVDNAKAFLKDFRNRLIDCYMQEWYGQMQLNDRYLFYTTFKQSCKIASYLFSVNVYTRKALIRFRLGVSFLHTHKLRYSHVTSEALDCPFCPGQMETEYHFLIICPKYNHIREIYLPPKYYIRPTAFKMTLLIANEKLSMKLATYLTKAFEVRTCGVNES